MSGCGDDNPDDEGREAAGSNTKSFPGRADGRSGSGAIDDATVMVVGAFFEAAESSWANSKARKSPVLASIALCIPNTPDHVLGRDAALRRPRMAIDLCI